MMYTVKEVAELTGVTIKTLHHYHRIGLLQPQKITEAGYRLYGERELERLQQILFYRELDFSLIAIKTALEDEPVRLECLAKQKALLFARRQRLDRLLGTINESITHGKEGKVMDKTIMFQGFGKEEWKEALSEQKRYLKDKYGYDLPVVEEAQVDNMNEQAEESQQFMSSMRDAFCNGWKADDARTQEILKNHLTFLNGHGHGIDSKSFAAQIRFFIGDDFHRSMLENHQAGLSYYLYAAADLYAAQMN